MRFAGGRVMNAYDSLDRSICLVKGETRLCPKLYRDGACRVFVGRKSSDGVPMAKNVVVSALIAVA